jgi:hypothetical protein
MKLVESIGADRGPRGRRFAAAAADAALLDVFAFTLGASTLPLPPAFRVASAVCVLVCFSLYVAIHLSAGSDSPTAEVVVYIPPGFRGDVIVLKGAAVPSPGSGANFEAFPGE